MYDEICPRGISDHMAIGASCLVSSSARRDGRQSMVDEEITSGTKTTGNIMIDDDGRTPILMNLGSIAPSPIAITSRSLAIAVQDTAAEHSTMPYRAPELFDVKTGSIIDTKVDIWSLGCTLYACLVGKSPFEMRSDETGGSLSLCVLGGDWRFPDEGAGGKKKAANQTGQSEDNEISESIRDLVRRCLKVEPAERPDVDELTKIVERVIEGLPE